MDGYRSIRRELHRAGRWHPLAVARVRVGVGIWLLVLTAILYTTGHAGQWGWLLIPTAALHFFLARRLFRIARESPDRRMQLQ